jgi:hypothetical protein
VDQLIKDNKSATRRTFNDYYLFVCGVVSGPIIITMLTVINMRFLHVEKKKRWLVLGIGLVLSLLYLVVIRYFEDQILSYSVLFASGAGLYKIYSQLAEDEIHIFDTLISNNDRLEISIFPYYGAGILVHTALRLLAEVVVI